MKGPRVLGTLAALLLCGILFTAAAGRALAQSHPGPPPRGPEGPGGPGGPPTSGTGRPGSDSASSTGVLRSPSGRPFGPPGRWWDDKSVVKAVGITQGQQRTMDAIFDANKATIVDTYKTLLSERSKLQTLTKTPQVDQAQVFAAIDRVNQAHAALEKATTQMLLEIRQQMQPDQISRLEHLPVTPTQ